MNRDFKGIWIPKDVWFSKELTLTEKLFFVEINSLDGPEGCYASNKHFCELFGIKDRRVTLVISCLIEKGFLSRELIFKEGSKQVEKRILRVINTPLHKSAPPSCTKVHHPPAQKCTTLLHKSADRIIQVNNTDYNNSLPIKGKPDNLKELKRFINQKNLTGDTITNRMEIFKAAENFLSSQEFIDQFNFINSRKIECDKKRVFQEWVTHGNYMDVKEMKINKISARWIQNSINNEDQNIRIPTKPNTPPKTGYGSLRNVPCKL